MRSRPPQLAHSRTSIEKTRCKSSAMGGDHLHFTVLLHGLPVNPVEWWDSHWIRDRISKKLGPAFPFEEQ
ncbi:MAG: hypothetical protein DMG08_05630 [Acidobacteria bacterium]|nr:MAG: hypothetical protein DMG08_05630 [Acidobacteriota bacterium]